MRTLGVNHAGVSAWCCHTLSLYVRLVGVITSKI